MIGLQNVEDSLILIVVKLSDQQCNSFLPSLAKPSMRQGECRTKSQLVPHTGTSQRQSNMMWAMAYRTYGDNLDGI